MPFKNPHPLYGVWMCMKNRCRNPNSKQFQDYGGRGIKVCDRWRNFLAFVEDMGPRPLGFTLERIDNDGDYTPENCRWATRREQMLNRRITAKVTIDGATYIAADLAKQSGLKADTIVKRAKEGLSFAEVMSQKRRTYMAGLALGGKASGAKQQAMTHCRNGHEFSQENTYITKEGWRNCRRCHADRQLARTERKMAAQLR